MNKDMKGRNILAIVLIIIVLVLAVTLIIINAVREKNNDGDSGAKPEVHYYMEQADGSKVNTSDKVSEDKQVDQLLIENSKIVYSGGITKITSKVTNNGSKIDDLSFNIKFIADDNSQIYEAVGYIGPLDAGKTSYITSSVTQDIVDAKDIKYEIKK